MFEIIEIGARFFLGLFAGSLLTEAVILVPYWRKMTPQNFQHLHAKMGQGLYRYFAPLTLVTVGAMIMATLVNWPHPLSWLVAMGLLLIAFLTFPVYFKRANASFAKGGLSDDELERELGRWATWHWSRTIMVLIAFGLTLLSGI